MGDGVSDAAVRAYDLEIGPWREGEPDRTADGWCFGLPPGIRPEQWPRDPVTGWPLMHGFTLKLPPGYRVHGPEVVALSFFATPAEGNDGGAGPDAVAADALDGADAHPRLHRMRDILDYAYAVILLTEAEYAGPSCRPPRDPALASGAPAPAWLRDGSAPAYEAFGGRARFQDVADPFPIHRPLRATERAEDPNAGLAPEEDYSDEPTASGYASFLYNAAGPGEPVDFQEHEWARGFASSCHVGGTMMPCQAIPDDFSPFYVEFEEGMGGYNFGGGNAQLDFGGMRFDWACG